ncbi:MAG TPA: hypothetical protein IGR64_01300 [Leptolyngbyaceae cyanobacterium M65_K2018_010]|nr:hypothetical protein [Leptolyngbyaceae cyanobacterium M65_K2018_010]
MTTHGQGGSPTPSFQQSFPELVPLILKEWPHLSREDLLATEGNPEQVIGYLCDQTRHTPTLIRLYLKELATLGNPPWSAPPPLRETTTVEGDRSTQVDAWLNELESRSAQLMEDFKAELLPELEQKARSHLGTSLLMAVGLGFILGLLLGGKRG